MDFLNKICYLPLNLYYINGIILRTIINYLVFKFINFLISIKCTDGDWGLGIGDWGLGIGPNPQSPIPNPQSPIPT